MYIPNQTEYNQLQAYARKVDYNIALDLVHDSILISTSFVECLKKISGGKYYYFTCNLTPEAPKIISERQCKVCKEILPDYMFPRIVNKGKIFFRWKCKKCAANWHKEYYRKFRIENKDKMYKIQKKYRINNSEKIKEKQKKYRAANRDKIREKQRIYNHRRREQLKLQKLNQSN